MRVTEIMKERMSFSFEVFPPKTDEGVSKLHGVLEELYAFKPDFISCTYGAGGSNAGRNLEVVSTIAASPNDTVSVTHFTCVGNTFDGIKKQIDDYLAAGVDHVLALRGDLPEGWEGTRGDFDYATDLVRFLRREYGGKLTIAVAGSPEGHIQARSLEADIAHLKQKQDLGADYVMTQLTYDMDQFRYWIDAVRAAGVTIPIDVGVMPVLSKDACIRMCLSMNGCAIPRKLAEVISRNYNDPDGFKKAGIEYTIDQIHEYVSIGIDGLHVYALNKSEDVSAILNESGIRTNKN